MNQEKAIGPSGSRREESASRPRGVARAELAARWGRRLIPSLRYLFTTEVHAYAFSIAANGLLAFFPFTLILLTVCRRWLHWEASYRVIVQFLRANLPTGADFVIRHLTTLVQGRPRLQLMSLVMLLFTSSGIFLPLEVALNKVWGIERNRSFLRNQGISLVLALVSGGLAVTSILLTAVAQSGVLSLFGWIDAPWLVPAISRGILEAFSIPLAVSIYFVIYYALPHGPVPVRRVLPAAVIAGSLTVAAKFVYVLTLPLLRFREVYGPFTLSATFLFWAYVVALILLFGAHLSVPTFGDTRAGRLEES